MMEPSESTPIMDVRPLRVVFFGQSIVSDLDNPAATTMRAILRALTQLGHHAVFLEERGNRPVTDLLRTHGAEALRAFNRHFPDIAYRTYELPAGRERLVWLGRELSVADAVVVQDTAPPGVIDAVRQGTAPHVVRVAQMTSDAPPPFGADLVLAPLGSKTGLPFGPAVSRRTSHASLHRQGVLVVAYGNGPLSAAIAERLSPLGSELISAGPVIDPPGRFVSEVELPDLYAARQAAIVIGAGKQPLAAARALLPLTAGCPTFVAGDFPSDPGAHMLDLEALTESTALEVVKRRIDSRGRSLPPEPAVDHRFDAGVQAAHLVQQVRAIKLAAQTGTNGMHNRQEQL